MEWIKEALKNYDSLSESEQAHVDAALDHFENLNHQNDDTCICGEVNCKDSYAHITSGY